jgi:hypothetical protein
MASTRGVVSPRIETAIRVDGPNAWRSIGTRAKNPLSPAGSRPIDPSLSARKRAARMTSGVPVSRPLKESDANTVRSRRRSSARMTPGSAGGGDGTVGTGAGLVAGGGVAVAHASVANRRRTTVRDMVAPEGTRGR